MKKNIFSHKKESGGCWAMGKASTLGYEATANSQPLNSDGWFFARVQVCDEKDVRDYPLCTEYPNGHKKPTGVIQKYSDRLRLAAYENDPEGLAAVKASNLETYGHEEGPTPDELFEKYGSWTAVLQKAFSPNLGMDVCCGPYDEYYWLYIELGYAE